LRAVWKIGDPDERKICESRGDRCGGLSASCNTIETKNDPRKLLQETKSEFADDYRQSGCRSQDECNRRCIDRVGTGRAGTLQDVTARKPYWRNRNSVRQLGQTLGEDARSILVRIEAEDSSARAERSSDRVKSWDPLWESRRSAQATRF